MIIKKGTANGDPSKSPASDGPVLPVKSSPLLRKPIKIGEAKEILDQMKILQDRLAEIRANCPHKETFRGLWSWRIGNMSERDICCECHYPVDDLIPQPRIITVTE